MFTKNMKAGYQGKKDAMRDKAAKLMNHPGEAKDVYFSKSCADKEKIRPYKDGGHVKQRHEVQKGIEMFKDEMERHRQKEHHKKMKHLNKEGEMDMKKSGCMKKMKDGGAMKDMKKKDCSVQKLAMGGVAKIRHEEATKGGMPTKPKKGTVREIM
jgi:hypothetical protein